jgi:hypothetical protein
VRNAVLFIDLSKNVRVESQDVVAWIPKKKIMVGVFGWCCVVHDCGFSVCILLGRASRVQLDRWLQQRCMLRVYQLGCLVAERGCRRMLAAEGCASYSEAGCCTARQPGSANYSAAARGAAAAAAAAAAAGTGAAR